MFVSPVDAACILTFSGNKCDSPWHLKCLDPPLDAVPDGEWFCPDCEEDPGAAVGAWATAKKSKAKGKRPSSPSEADAGVKRKAPPKTKVIGIGMLINALISKRRLMVASSPPCKEKETVEGFLLDYIINVFNPYPGYMYPVLHSLCMHENGNAKLLFNTLHRSLTYIISGGPIQTLLAGVM